MPGMDPRDDETPAVEEDSDPNSGEQPEHEGTEEALSGVDELRLDAVQEGWEGVEPEEISGEVNPELPLEAGAEYEVTVENGDGREHALELLDGGEAVLESSEEVAAEGDVATLAFEATVEMAWYVCEYHDERMRGRIGFPEESAGED